MECEIAVSGYRGGLSRIKDTGIIQIFIWVSLRSFKEMEIN